MSSYIADNRGKQAKPQKTRRSGGMRKTRRGYEGQKEPRASSQTTHAVSSLCKPCCQTPPPSACGLYSPSEFHTQMLIYINFSLGKTSKKSSYLLKKPLHPSEPSPGFSLNACSSCALLLPHHPSRLSLERQMA